MFKKCSCFILKFLFLQSSSSELTSSHWDGKLFKPRLLSPEGNVPSKATGQKLLLKSEKICKITYQTNSTGPRHWGKIWLLPSWLKFCVQSGKLQWTYHFSSEPLGWKGYISSGNPGSSYCPVSRVSLIIDWLHSVASPPGLGNVTCVRKLKGIPWAWNVQGQNPGRKRVLVVTSFSPLPPLWFEKTLFFLSPRF